MIALVNIIMDEIYIVILNTSSMHIMVLCGAPLDKTIGFQEHKHNLSIDCNVHFFTVAKLNGGGTTLHQRKYVGIYQHSICENITWHARK